jgi:hypothetical protein
MTAVDRQTDTFSKHRSSKSSRRLKARPQGLDAPTTYRVSAYNRSRHSCPNKYKIERKYRPCPLGPKIPRKQGGMPHFRLDLLYLDASPFMKCMRGSL